MISFDRTLKIQRIGTLLSVILLIIAVDLLIVIYYQHKETDIALQKLDSPGPGATIGKGELMTNRYRWECELVKVIDGDTIEAEIHLDFGVKLQAKLRLKGIDTPEIHTAKHNTEEYRKGIAAKEFVEERFKIQGKKFWIETAGKRKGKYGRFVVDVLMPSGDYLGVLLVKAGHAVKKEY